MGVQVQLSDEAIIALGALCMTFPDSIGFVDDRTEGGFTTLDDETYDALMDQALPHEGVEDVILRLIRR